jgi:cell wall-associated NlpC family hydrolase
MKLRISVVSCALVLVMTLCYSGARAESYRFGPSGSIPDAAGSALSIEGLPGEAPPAIEADLKPVNPIIRDSSGVNTAAAGKSRATARKRTSLASRNGNLMMRLVRHSMNYIGVPYSWAGTSSYGFDCSGFVWKMFSSFGISLPRMADSQYLKGVPVPLSDVQPGDLVFFSTYTAGVSHVGIAVGNNRFIHSSSSRGVIISDLSDPYYSIRYVGARRIQ